MWVRNHNTGFAATREEVLAAVKTQVSDETLAALPPRK
jgi:hypothetical protein